LGEINFRWVERKPVEQPGGTQIELMWNGERMLTG